MSEEGQRILACLEQVALVHARRAEQPAFDAAVFAVKRFQHERLQLTYQDLLKHPRYAAAASFFLEDLYGPRDFTRRDAQFARVIPALVRLFPAEIVRTVAHLARLHALSEALDAAVATHLLNVPVDLASYARAWRAVGQRQDRMEQIALMRAVGDALDRYTRRRGLWHTLRVMRLPARSAGLLELQQFLERGFDTFHGMGGAGEFLDAISSRESALVAALFDAESAAFDVPAEAFVRMATQRLGEPP
jgi:hypothetical protein